MLNSFRKILFFIDSGHVFCRNRFCKLPWKFWLCSNILWLLQIFLSVTVEDLIFILKLKVYSFHFVICILWVLCPFIVFNLFSHVQRNLILFLKLKLIVLLNVKNSVCIFSEWSPILILLLVIIFSWFKRFIILLWSHFLTW